MLNALFPSLFEKTFFIVGCQLMITSLTTYLTFLLFKKADPEIETEDLTNLQVMKHCNPNYRWLFTPGFIIFLLLADTAVFLVLLFWGADQSLTISFPLFSVWSITTGIELELVLLSYDHGLGRKVAALTGCIVFFALLIGAYSKIDFGFLEIPLFIALCFLLILSIAQILVGMSTIKQRVIAFFGVIIFSLYLVFDFFQIAQKEKIDPHGSWPEAMHVSIKIYLDIINLFLQLLKAMGKSHH